MIDSGGTEVISLTNDGTPEVWSLGGQIGVKVTKDARGRIHADDNGHGWTRSACVPR